MKDGTFKWFPVAPNASRVEAQQLLDFYKNATDVRSAKFAHR